MSSPAHPDAISAWRPITAELRRVVGESAYGIWLAAVEPLACEGDELVLAAPTDTARWLATRFGPVIERCARSVLGPQARVRFRGHAPGNPPTGAAAASCPVTTASLHPRYNFEQFIIGDGNRFAHAAALVAAELPGQAYNPLFLYGSPGLGKTHLLHAIGNYISAFGGGTVIRCTTAETFTNHFLAALRGQSLDAFKSAYRDADVLLIDDVQFLASKAKTEEEFFHTFNALYDNGRQLVLTCDRLPHALVALEQRLRERFDAGLVAEIEPPDHATRVAILRKRATLDGIRPADDAALELIAERVTTNIRALEGALIRVVAFHSLTQRPIDVPLTREVLDAMYPPRPVPLRSAPSIPAVQAAVAGHFGLSVSELTSTNRAPRVNWPRQLAIHLSRELTPASLPAIGQAFGGRNHATVVHACKRVSQRLASDQQAVDTLAELQAILARAQADRDC